MIHWKQTNPASVDGGRDWVLNKRFPITRRSRRTDTRAFASKGFSRRVRGSIHACRSAQTAVLSRGGDGGAYAVRQGPAYGAGAAFEPNRCNQSVLAISD